MTGFIYCAQAAINQFFARSIRCTHGLMLITCALSLLAVLPSNARAFDFEYVEPSSDFHFEVKRYEGNPIIHREMPGLDGKKGKNINGPSLIRAPKWLDDPLGKYYLYFAHHSGKHIRLAYADSLGGPWKIHKGGVLPINKAAVSGHIASPDVHVDHQQQRIRMYFHGPADNGSGQKSFVAASKDGLNFKAKDEILGEFYMRVIEHDGWYYALAKNGNNGGLLYRSKDPFTGFEKGPRILPRVRHMALWKHDDMLYVFFSRGKDKPERIMVSRVENLDDDWRDWKFTKPQTVLKPEKDYEGANKPVRRSGFGSAKGFVHQLRDPAIYVEDDRLYLLYCAAGESSIAIAHLNFVEQSDGN